MIINTDTLDKSFELRFLKAAAGLSNRQIAARTPSRLPEHAIGCAIKYPQAVEETEAAIKELLQEQLEDKSDNSPA